MTTLIERLRESRKNPAVLKLQLVAVRGSKPNSLIFVFEGLDDIGVYETWISRTKVTPAYEYESVPGCGKEQLIGLYNQLVEHEPAFLRNVYFFVDCDFDEYFEASKHVFIYSQ